MNLVIATLKTWNIARAKAFKENYQGIHDIQIICEKSELCSLVLESYQPDYIFFPHWSYLIPKEIYERWTCVIFHMTDLPYGRGGSPLQNLIERGATETKLSALRAVGELDAGPIYMKKTLSLKGNADEILNRASRIIFDEMIPAFLEKQIIPVSQKGEPVYFKRRIPEQSRMTCDMNAMKIYDHIRMLDGEGYPRAYIPFENCCLTFHDAKIEHGEVHARVIIKDTTETEKGRTGNEKNFGNSGAS